MVFLGFFTGALLVNNRVRSIERALETTETKTETSFSWQRRFSLNFFSNFRLVNFRVKINETMNYCRTVGHIFGVDFLLEETVDFVSCLESVNNFWEEKLENFKEPQDDNENQLICPAQMVVWDTESTDNLSNLLSQNLKGPLESPQSVSILHSESELLLLRWKVHVRSPTEVKRRYASRILQ